MKSNESYSRLSVGIAAFGPSAGMQGACNQPAARPESPLKREIGQLQEAIALQSKTIDELFDKLRPVFQQRPLTPDEKNAGCPIMAEVPTSVFENRLGVDKNTAQLQFLIDTLEV